MGLIKRMLARGLQGVEPGEPGAAPPLGSEPSPGSWPPGPPPMSPPTAPGPAPSLTQASYGLEAWRYPVALGPKELMDNGFQSCRSVIEAAFLANGQTILLADVTPGQWPDAPPGLSDRARVLRVNDVYIAQEPTGDPFLEVKSDRNERHNLIRVIWEVAVALHDAYLESMDPERTWQIGLKDETTILFLARPEELGAIGRRPEIHTILDLGKLQPA